MTPNDILNGKIYNYLIVKEISFNSVSLIDLISVIYDITNNKSILDETLLDLPYPVMLKPNKYDKSTYKGKQIQFLALYFDKTSFVCGDETFDFDVSYLNEDNPFADNILCDMQYYNDLNVSKY